MIMLKNFIIHYIVIIRSIFFYCLPGGYFLIPTSFVWSAAVRAPAAKQNAHTESFSFTIVHANDEAMISPDPVESGVSILGNFNQYRLSLSRRWII